MIFDWKSEGLSTRLANVILVYLDFNSSEISRENVLAIDPESLGRQYNCGKITKNEFVAWQAGYGLTDYLEMEKNKKIAGIEAQIERLQLQLKKLRDGSKAA